MSTRTIVGNLAVDPQAVRAGRVQIVKLQVVQDTGEDRQGAWVAHDDATTHFVEAKFQLGENVLATLHKGDAVIVVGYEHTVSWGEGENKRSAASSTPTQSARTSAAVPHNPSVRSGARGRLRGSSPVQES